MSPTTREADAALDALVADALAEVEDEDAEPVEMAMEPDADAADGWAIVCTLSPVAFVQDTLLAMVALLRSVRSAHCGHTRRQT